MMSLSPDPDISQPVETPETREVLERWRQGKINIGDELARLETERDEARALAILLAEAIVSTLEKNRHLADGENCTLARLKAAVPHWK